MNNNDAARQVLDRFASQIRWVTDAVMNSFSLEPIFRDDVRQEAEILVITYAGLLHKHAAYSGQLRRWAANVSNNETRVKALLAYNLRINLCQWASRWIHRNHGETMMLRLDDYLEDGKAPAPNFDGKYGDQLNQPLVEAAEDTCLNAMLLAEQEAELRHEYPYFTAQVLDGLSIDELRDLESRKITRPQVTYRLKKEKTQFIERVSNG